MWRSTLCVTLAVFAACSGPVSGDTTSVTGPESTSSTVLPSTVGPLTTITPVQSTTIPPTTSTTASPYARPDWLGTRPLPLRPDGHGEVQATPPDLVDRQLETIDLLDPPLMVGYEASIDFLPPDVMARSSWTEECPVPVEELRYLTMTHVGFDGEFHTGEMIVNASVASDVIEVFRKLFEARFPIEQMRVIALEEVDAPPTGDWNETTSFVCRPAVGSTSWSQHAYGLAIDVNPFHNPYLKDDLVIPELASAYVDRDDVRAGMIYEGDVVVRAFADIGWGWGGNWNTLKDWMHFSLTGR